MRTTSSLAFRHTLTTLALAAITAACSTEMPTAEVASLANRGAAADASMREHRVDGRCTLQFSAPPMPLTPVFTQTDEGTCVLTGLGRSHLIGTLTINFLTGTQVGTRTITAANGDQLFITAVGTSSMTVPGQVAFVATLTITGGTGRFEGATGELEGRGVALLAARTTTVEFEGMVVYEPGK